MVIVICDDDGEELERIRQICLEQCSEQDDIYTYADSKELYKRLKEHEWRVDLFILDIEMPGVDGITLKQQISAMHKDTNIVFLTNHSEIMDKAFGRYVIGFVEKRDYKQRICDYIEEVRQQTHQHICMVIGDSGGVHEIDQREIIKIEAKHVYSEVERSLYYNGDKERMENAIQEYRISLNRWEELLDMEEFYRINRSLIINFRYIRRINDRNELEFMDGRTYEIPIKKRKTVRHAYNQYCMRKARCIE